jgi:hypothetical protein
LLRAAHTSSRSSRKRDYSSPEWAGVEHQGHVTAGVADFVGNNLELANENRQREGQPPIDASSEKMTKRDGFK